MNTSCVYDQADDLTGLLGHQLDRKGSFMDKDAILQYLYEAQVFAILEKYYPRHQVKPATQYFVEELFGQ
jgi:hypothetical protein